MKHQTMVILLLVLCLLATGCGAGQKAVPTMVVITRIVTPGSTFAPDPTPTRVPPPTPTEVPVPPIERLCLQIDDSQSLYDDLEPIKENIGKILTLAGMSVVLHSVNCDATLLISLVGTPKSALYSGQTCYTGAGVVGEMTLRLPDGESLARPISGGNPTDTGWTVGCPTAEEAPFYYAVMGPLVLGLESFWGTEILVYLEAVNLQNPDWRRIRIATSDQRDPDAVFPVIINVLNTHSDAWVRAGALQSLEQLSDLPSEGLDAIRQSLDDEDELVREKALSMLAHFEPDAPEVVADENLWMLDSAGESQRIAGARILGQTGAYAPIIQALIDVLEDPEETDAVREAVALALADIGPGAVPWLVETLVHENVKVVRAGALALKEMGSEAESAVPALIRCMERDYRHTGGECSDALVAIGPAAVQPLLDAFVARAADDCMYKHWIVEALPALRSASPDVRGAVPVLIDCLERKLNAEEDDSVEMRALSRLTGRNFGPHVDAWREWWSENQ